MARAAVLIGRTVSDLVRNVITFTVMVIVAVPASPVDSTSVVT